MSTQKTTWARRALLSALAALGVAAAGPLATAEEGQTAGAKPKGKVVVELFTSQGCYSCPPADAFLGDLLKNPNVIALSLHVDYWDYLGWKDRFSSPAFTKRQRDYSRALGGGGRIYTPQMVIDGAVGMVGSRRRPVSMAVKAGAGHKDLVRVGLARDGGTLAIRLTPTDTAKAVRIRAPLDVVLVGYDGPHTVEIAVGENGGKTLVYHNVVRTQKIVGDWFNTDKALQVPIDGSLKGYAVYVQAPGPGLIVGAESIEF